MINTTEKTQDIDYPNMFSTQMTYNYKSFNTILESIPDIWKEVTVNNFGKEETIPLAINVAQHIRRIDPHRLWSGFLTKIEQDISNYPQVEQINLFTKLILEVDDYPISHFDLNNVLDKVLGSTIKSEVYFSNMQELKYGFSSITNVAICNVTTERRNELLVEKIQQRDFCSVKDILDSNRVQPSDLRSIKIDNISLQDYLQKQLVEYKEEILKNQSIKNIDKLYDYIKNSKTFDSVSKEILNYHILEDNIKKINKEINDNDRVLYKKKM